MHAWDALTPLEETLRFLDDAISAGKIAYYGFSNFLGWHVTKAVHLARAAGWAPPVTLQPQYNLLVRDIELEIVPACLDAGIGLLPWSPLAGGWLAGKYQRDVMPTGATRLGENPARGMEAFEARNAEERTWRVIAAVGELAAARGVTAAEVALAWVAAQPAVTSVILGARTPEQLAENLKAGELVADRRGDRRAQRGERAGDRRLSLRQGRRRAAPPQARGRALVRPASRQAGCQVGWKRPAGERVKISTPVSVTPTECSNCAESERSLVTAVQSSSSTLVSGRPRLIIGSMVKNIPGSSTGPVPQRP